MTKLIRDALGKDVPQYFNEDKQVFAVRTTDGSVVTADDFNFRATRLLRSTEGDGAPLPQLWDAEAQKWVLDTGQGGSGGGTGTSFNFNLLGELSDVSELPSTGNEVNDAYMINGEVHFWNGTSWINAGAIVGERGPRGLKGEKGEAGEKGADGKSAYQLAVENGFVGNESDWLESLEGEQGEAGTTDYNALNNKPTIPSFTSQLTNDSNFITQAILDALKNVANGIAGLDANGLISLAQLPPTTKELRVVNDLAERDALESFEGLGCYVKNATPEVSTGGAFYMYDGTVWHKTSSDSEFMAVIDWSNILNKPTTFTPSSHTHLMSEVSGLIQALNGKVEKVAGKQLSTEDFTNAEKTKLAELSNYTLPKATTSTLGGVKPDGSTIVIDENGVLRVVGGGAEVTKESITNALEYTPADVEDLSTLQTQFNEHLANDNEGIKHKASQISIEPVDGLDAQTLQQAIAANFTQVVNGKVLLETTLTTKGSPVVKVDDIPTFTEINAAILTMPDKPTDLRIYDSGVEGVLIEGLVGWEGIGGYQFTKEATNLYLKTSGEPQGGYSGVIFSTVNKIDLSLYNSAKIVFTGNLQMAGSYPGHLALQIKSEKSFWDASIAVASTEEAGVHTDKVISLDISSLNGEYYLIILSKYLVEARISSIVLEV